MNRFARLLILLVVAPLAHAQDVAPPTMPAFDVAALDTTVNVCEHAYQYACGGWHANHPMPSDVSFWSRPFTQFSRQVEDYVRTLIEHATRSGINRTPDEQKIGDYYAACLDTTTIEQRRLTPLRSELMLIDGMTSVKELPSVLGALHRTLPFASNDGEPLVYVFAWSDPVDGGQARRLWIGPSGLGLPGRDYYLNTDSTSVVLRMQYQAHVAQMLQLLGATRAEAVQQATAILALEARLAEARLPNSVLRNDAAATSNPMTPDDLQALTPHFHWGDFLRAHGIPESPRLNVMQPAYLRALDSLLVVEPLDTWKAYLRWQLITERTKLLPSAFRKARFAFYGQILQGQSAPPDREHICITHLKRDLPQALSRMFIEQVFRPEMRVQTLAMFEEIKTVMRRRIESTDWMAPETKQAALEKLDAVRIGVGQPDVWLDDRRVVMRRDDFYGNVQRAGATSRRTDFDGLGQPVDINDWSDPATYIGAGYYNQLNAIIVTAGMLLFFDDAASDPAVRYGGLGHLLAHELLHAFDPKGRQYDAEGRLRDWWTAADAARFDERARCVADQFSALEYAPGIPIDGAYIVSEQVAELSAWSIAWEAYEQATAEQPQPMVAGLNPQQRYFLTNAQLWCADATEGQWRAFAAGGSSKAWSAPMVHGTVLNLPAFAEAFGCRAGQPMVKPPEQVCKVW